MNTLSFALLLITALFVTLLILKKIGLKRACAMCAAVSGTWIALLALYTVYAWGDRRVIALLMGQTIVGLYFMLERKTPARTHIFRLPFILTLTAAAAAVLDVAVDSTALYLITLVWAVTIFLFRYRAQGTLKRAVDALIACCKNL